MKEKNISGGYSRIKTMLLAGGLAVPVTIAKN
jgi:hypothetical protein